MKSRADEDENGKRELKGEMGCRCPRCAAMTNASHASRNSTTMVRGSSKWSRAMSVRTERGWLVAETLWLWTCSSQAFRVERGGVVVVHFLVG